MKTIKKPLTRYIKNRRLLLFSFVCLTILALLTIRLFDYYSERSKLDILSQSAEQYIGQVVGLPGLSQTSDKSYCRYANQKYKKGPLQCVTQKRAIFKVNGVSEANNLLNIISGYSESRLQPIHGEDIKFKDSAVRQVITQDIVLSNNSCFVDYSYPSGGYGSTFSNSLTVTVYCGISADFEHFPVD